MKCRIKPFTQNCESVFALWEKDRIPTFRSIMLYNTRLPCFDLRVLVRKGLILSK